MKILGLCVLPKWHRTPKTKKIKRAKLLLYFRQEHFWPVLQFARPARYCKTPWCHNPNHYRIKLVRSVERRLKYRPAYRVAPRGEYCLAQEKIALQSKAIAIGMRTCISHVRLWGRGWVRPKLETRIRLEEFGVALDDWLIESHAHKPFWRWANEIGTKEAMRILGVSRDTVIDLKKGKRCPTWIHDKLKARGLQVW